MDIKITVDIPALDRLVDALDGQLSGNAAAPAEDKPRGRGRPPKTETSAPAETAASPSSEEQASTSADTANSASQTTTSPSDLTGTEEEQIAAVKEKAMLLNQKKGRDVLVSTLSEFGAANISALAADKRAAFIAKVEELTAA